MSAQSTSLGSIHRDEWSDDRLRSVAPSVFAAQAMPGVSSSYAFVPTGRLVDRLRDAGWVPVFATEQRVRLDGRRGFQRHLIRFQCRDVVPVRGEYSVELCLLTSHDRSSAYQLYPGLFRFICKNGLFVADDNFSRVTLRHAGFTPDEVVEASFGILDTVPEITERVEAFRARQVTVAESLAFATAALVLRFCDAGTAPIGAETLLEVCRPEDAGDDLWHVFNRAQEFLCRGGLRDATRRRPNGRPFARTRAIIGLDRTVRLNKQLWSLAQRLANGDPLTVAE